MTTIRQAAELEVIGRIADRAFGWYSANDVMTGAVTAATFRRNILMDVLACHKNCPLDLDALLEADDSNFMHDIAGINRHLNRTTFQLEDCFMPRFAMREKVHG